MADAVQVLRIRCGTGNCFLVSCGREAVLVDTGTAPFREKVLAACRGVSLRLILLTHGHIDHVQNAAFLAQKLEVPIAMHRDDLPLVENNLAQPLFPQGIFGRVLLAVSLRAMQGIIPSFSPTVLLREGDGLEEYGIPARVLELPGHTLGSIGLDVEGTHLLVGDALMHWAVPGCPAIYHDRDKMRESARRLAGLGERQVHFGHGNSCRNRAWIK